MARPWIATNVIDDSCLSKDLWRTRVRPTALWWKLIRAIVGWGLLDGICITRPERTAGAPLGRGVASSRRVATGARVRHYTATRQPIFSPTEGSGALI